MVLSPGDTVTAGAVLLAVIAIAYGGTFLLRSMPGSRRPMTSKAFFRAGHAHAGVLVILGLSDHDLDQHRGRAVAGPATQRWCVVCRDLDAGRILPLRHRPRPRAAQPAPHLVVDRGRLAHGRPGLCRSRLDHGRCPLGLLGRLLLALLAFAGTSAALLIVTSQVVPGWRPAGIQRPLDPRPTEPAAEPGSTRFGRRRSRSLLRAVPTDCVDPATSRVERNRCSSRLGAGARCRPRQPRIPGRHGPGVRRSRDGRDRYDKRTAGYSVLARDFAALAEDAIEPPTYSPTRQVSIRSGLRSWVLAKAPGWLR